MRGGGDDEQKKKEQPKTYDILVETSMYYTCKVQAKNQKEAIQKVKMLKDVRQETDDVKWEPGSESEMWCAKVRTPSQGF